MIDFGDDAMRDAIRDKISELDRNIGIIQTDLLWLKENYKNTQATMTKMVTLLEEQKSKTDSISISFEDTKSICKSNNNWINKVGYKVIGISALISAVIIFIWNILVNQLHIFG